MRALPLERRGHRLEIPADAAGPGWSRKGISGAFPLTGYRSMYGATKLASELLVEEYRAMYGLRTVVNRCGVSRVPGRWARSTRDFSCSGRHVTSTVACCPSWGSAAKVSRFETCCTWPICTISYGCRSRDLDRHSGAVLNVGGGHAQSLSLAELTARCSERAGHSLPVGADPRTSEADVPYYVSDNTAATAATGWAPTRSLDRILDDVFDWLREHRATLEPVLGSPAPAPVPATTS